MRQLITLLYIFLAATFSLSAQQPEAPPEAPPGTEVYLVEIVREDGAVRLGTPRNVSQRLGYDNQPSFSPSGEQLFYVAIDKDQSDIWIYDLATQKRRRLTQTAASEYSPTPIPGEKAISVIRQGIDGRQLLWRIPLDGGEPSFLIPDIEPIGYHAWSGAKDLALFVLGEPATLQAARRGPGAGKILAHDIGRALKPMPGKAEIAFVHKLDAETWTIRQANLSTGRITDLLKTRPGREDFTISPSGELWMGDDGILWMAAAGAGEWSEVADLAEHGMRDITRLAFHPEGGLMALVVEEPFRK